MDKFNSFYTDFLYKNKPVTPELFNLGIDILMKSTDFSVQEDVVYKLLNLYPNEYKLYYLMGSIYKNHSTDKSLYWFNKCYSIDPQYVENILDLTKILFDNGTIRRIVMLYKIWVF